MHESVKLFGIQIDCLDKNQAVSHLFDLISESPRRCHYVVTPNTDHIVKLNEDIAFKAAYDQASVILADGRPLVMVSRWLGKALPSVVPGSDLVPAIFEASVKRQQPITVFLLGAGPGVADKAARAIEGQWGSHVKIVGTHCPDLGFEKSPAVCDEIIEIINQAQPDVLVLGLGAPKQELWIHQHHQRIKAGVALCVGATIDFLAGEKKRAPQWVQACSMEWAYRVYQEPKRLAGRYAYDILMFPYLIAREFINSKRRGT